MINAHEASERAKKRRKEISIEQQKEIGDKIEELCDENGSTILICQGKLINETILVLEEYGYKVECDEEYTTISWDL